MTKRITSVILVLLIVLSFAMSGVSAVPADLTVIDGKSETIDFEGISAVPSNFVMNNGGKADISTTEVHSGSQSLRFTATSGGYIKMWFTPTITFEANSKYYLSFWYYTDSWEGSLTASDLTSYVFSSKTKGQWNKMWLQIDTSSYTNCIGSSLATTFWSTGAGNYVYIDDLEIAKVDSFTGIVNEVPSGASATATKTINFETSVSGFTPVDSALSSGGVSINAPHWGEASYKFIGGGSADDYKTYFLNVNTVFGDSVALAADNTYYISYYVYSPDKAVSTGIHMIDGNKVVVAKTDVPQGEWTKVSGLFTPDADNIAEANSHLLRVDVYNAESSPVYFDDFVLAKLSGAVADVALTQSEIDYDFFNNKATVTFTSNVALDSLNAEDISVSDNASVVMASVSDDGMSVNVALSNLALGMDYELTFTDVKDVFGRVNTVTAEATTPAAYNLTEVTETVDGANATYTRTVRKNNAGTENIAFIVISYNTEGEMIDIGMHTQAVSDTSGDVPFTVTIEKGTTYKVMTVERDTLASVE